MHLSRLVNTLQICFIIETALYFKTFASDSCEAKSENGVQCNLQQKSPLVGKKRYILYDVNPGEGFNLRRDVYMRVASFVQKLRQENLADDWILVLPPWGPLYHWKSKDLGLQMQVPWGKFFDLPSLSRYTPVIEFSQFLKDHGLVIEELYYLQHYAEGWTDGKWEERMDLRECMEEVPYSMEEDGRYRGWFWGFEEPYAEDFHCLSIQGSSSTLIPLIHNSRASSIMIDRAEVILHDIYGNEDYWMVRRSMRFADRLIEIGNDFRHLHMESDDKSDKTEISENWMIDHPDPGTATGGPYMGVHLRRQDFVQARPNDVPSVEHAARQINKKLQELNLTVAFIATDAPNSEFSILKRHLPGAIRFQPNLELRKEMGDGGVAIVDQWICAHARYFTGSYESTFSFRIQEEREILGFSPETTFNRLCGNNQTECKQPSRWTIAHH